MIRKSLPALDAWWAPFFPGDHAQTTGWSAHEIRHFLRAPASTAVERRRRAAAVPGGARPGRTRRQTGHRLRLGGRAPFPRGIFALLGARDIPRGVLAAHQKHPSRPRHLPDAAE